jgi:hypothetical protein
MHFTTWIVILAFTFTLAGASPAVSSLHHPLQCQYCSEKGLQGRGVIARDVMEAREPVEAVR